MSFCPQPPDNIWICLWKHNFLQENSRLPPSLAPSVAFQLFFLPLHTAAAWTGFSRVARLKIESGLRVWILFHVVLLELGACKYLNNDSIKDNSHLDLMISLQSGLEEFAINPRFDCFPVVAGGQMNMWQQCQGIPSCFIWRPVQFSGAHFCLGEWGQFARSASREDKCILHEAN